MTDDTPMDLSDDERQRVQARHTDPLAERLYLAHKQWESCEGLTPDMFTMFAKRLCDLVVKHLYIACAGRWEDDIQDIDSMREWMRRAAAASVKSALRGVLRETRREVSSARGAEGVNTVDVVLLALLTCSVLGAILCAVRDFYFSYRTSDDGLTVDAVIRSWKKT